MRVAVLAAALATCLVLPVSPGVGADAKPRVTLIGDSPATAIQYTSSARAILAEGITLQLEVYPCRRVAQTSCPYDGVLPPTLIDLAATKGAALGETVIVAVGYNDYESEYAENIKAGLSALRAAGVKRILWTTLRAERAQYLSMNDAIRDAAARNQDVTVVDWNLYSRSHPDWFQPDGIHLGGAGAEAMARLFHDALVKLDIPLRPKVSVMTIATNLPSAAVRRPFRARLQAVGGKGPYRWSMVGKRPNGLTLSTAGLLRWRPTSAGRFSFVVRAIDANGTAATRPLRVSVRR